MTKGLKVLPNKVFRFIQPALCSCWNERLSTAPELNRWKVFWLFWFLCGNEVYTDRISAK
ncbi:unknown protein [Microcystis aeruginosa NIES-843]|uniref:Uncharacterized protein n=1 Tax=Microcystis aeruginosa (strain NIES-843 / IAM M-2473) TaxID=449447 RepID=B0JQT1_MICAN|nr:unknown protein [Microcystis aeruginosa NIES-843]